MHLRPVGLDLSSENLNFKNFFVLCLMFKRVYNFRFITNKVIFLTIKQITVKKLHVKNYGVVLSLYYTFVKVKSFKNCILKSRIQVI